MLELKNQIFNFSFFESKISQIDIVKFQLIFRDLPQNPHGYIVPHEKFQDKF
jgi:hypothetical protein